VAGTTQRSAETRTKTGSSATTRLSRQRGHQRSRLVAVVDDGDGGRVSRFRFHLCYPDVRLTFKALNHLLYVSSQIR
jgi:hypothetical protein